MHKGKDSYTTWETFWLKSFPHHLPRNVNGQEASLLHKGTVATALHYENGRQHGLTQDIFLRGGAKIHVL